jgi:hypothetical protein
MKNGLIGFFGLLLCSCASVDTLPTGVDLRLAAHREGSAIRLNDGRLVSVRVIRAEERVINSMCGLWSPPDSIVVVDDSSNCPRVELTLAHELLHAYGRHHEPDGIMSEHAEEVSMVKVQQWADALDYFKSPAEKSAEWRPR